MRTKCLIPSKLRIPLFLAAFYYSLGGALATVDPFAFCTDSCKDPGPCQNAGVAAQCKKVCSGDLWKQAARLQLSRDNKTFRMERDAKKKDGMLVGSPIGKCLGMTLSEPEKKQEITKEGPKPLLPAEIPAHIGKPQTSNSINDLCAAAIKKEMGALERDKETLQARNKDLATALEAIKHN